MVGSHVSNCDEYASCLHVHTILKLTWFVSSEDGIPLELNLLCRRFILIPTTQSALKMTTSNELLHLEGGTPQDFYRAGS